MTRMNKGGLNDWCTKRRKKRVTLTLFSVSIVFFYQSPFTTPSDIIWFELSIERPRWSLKKTLRSSSF